MRKLVFAVLGVVALALNSGASAAAESAPSGESVNASVLTKRVVTLWTEPGFTPVGEQIRRAPLPSGRVCTPRTDDIDFRVNLRNTAVMYQNVESIDDNPGAHCDWQLIDARGRHSTWVEADIRDLRNIGSGWRDRAVAIRFT
jgi:hypothetical protein